MHKTDDQISKYEFQIMNTTIWHGLEGGEGEKFLGHNILPKQTFHSFVNMVKDTVTEMADCSPKIYALPLP